MIVFRWLGQACFLLFLPGGIHVLIDPPHPQVGYSISAHSIPADLVFVSHEHMDHNYVEAAAPTVRGRPRVISPLAGPGEQTGDYEENTLDPGAPTIKFSRIFAYHDNVQGADRGIDTITCLKTNGLRIVHLGDLGQLSLTPEQIKEIGPCDVLMIPVGGFFTIDGAQAVAIVNQLHPRVIIPMHYQTPALNADLQGKLGPVTAFLEAIRGQAAIKTVAARDLKLSAATLPGRQTVYVLRYQ
jgi:L-ascorbate metabolism protein UlaG (beta-lactamase superfamily)